MLSTNDPDPGLKQKSSAKYFANLDILRCRDGMPLFSFFIKKSAQISRDLQDMGPSLALWHTETFRQHK
jgi:hypothetical protein